MDKYIKALLISDSRAIIPQFGAIQAWRDETPISLSFNPYLNFDDGKLEALIVEQEGVSADEARLKISRAVDHYNNSLADGERLVLSGIGSFIKEENGSVFFEADPNYTEGLLTETLNMGKSPMDFVMNSTNEIEEPQDVQQPDENQNEKVSTDEETMKQDGEQNIEKHNEQGVTASDEPTADVGGEKPQSANKSVAAPAVREKKGGNSSKVLLIILLLLILIGAGIYFLFVSKDNYVRRLFFGLPVRVEVPVAKPTPEVKPDTVVKPAPKPIEQEPVVAQPLTKRYNIIVGSFKEEKHAVKMVQDLVQKGYKEAFVGKRKDKDNFYVVIASFNNITEAEKAQEEIVNGPHRIQSWMTNSGENAR